MGRAVQVTDPVVIAAYIAAVHGPEAANLPSNMQLFTVDIFGASTVHPEGTPTPDHLAINTWRVGAGTRLFNRY